MNTNKPKQPALSTQLSDTVASLQEILPLEASFDFIHRTLYLGKTRSYFLALNGFCKTEILQQIFSDLQDPLFTLDDHVNNILAYMNSKIGYAQISLSDSIDDVVQNILSGPVALFIDGFAQAILIDVRTYPTRSISEPDTEHVTTGARDGFVEALLINTNLIRRRIRSPHLTFSMHKVGEKSNTDIAIAYLDDSIDHELLSSLIDTISSLKITALTMGSKSLEELLVPKKLWHPLPSILSTERPDVACSYLMEGHILILVDNSPSVLVLPTSIFQFTQSPEDYYKSPIVGSYARLVRFLCIPTSLLLMPFFLLITAYAPTTALSWGFFSGEITNPTRMIFYVFAVEFLLDLFRYSASLNSNRFSASLSLIGGLLIGEMAINLKWVSTETLFYGAITLLSSLSINHLEFSDGIRIYRIFMILLTACLGFPGFFLSLLLVLCSMITTPTFANTGYLWPLFPWNAKALLPLLFRSSTHNAQPCTIWHQNKGIKKTQVSDNDNLS